MKYKAGEARRQELIAKHAGKPGLRGKIDAFCISCIYDPFSGDGTWRQQTDGCTAVTCPLYEVRPKSEAQS